MGRKYKRVGVQRTSSTHTDLTVLAMLRSVQEGYSLDLVCDLYNVKSDTLYRYLSGRLRTKVTGYTTTDNFYSRPKPRRSGRVNNKPHFTTLWNSYVFTQTVT